MLTLDHIALAAETLQAGVDRAEAALGVRLAGGGQHALMGTHNRLLGLGDLYFEVIAIDPMAAKPAFPRWFDLDRFTGPPRLSNWICRCADLDMALAASPPGTGLPVSVARGDLRWRMGVPADGTLPFDNRFPALIEWQGPAHPVQRLADSGLRLTRLEVAHPDAPALQAALAGRFDDPRVAVVQGPAALRATFDTPHGPRILE